MHILHDAVPVVAGADADQAFHQLVPGAGQVGGRQFARYDGFLQAVAQDHVQRVGDLIGIDANQAGLYPTIDAQQVVGLPGFSLTAENAPDDGHQERDGLRRARGLHFQQQ